MLVMGKSWIKLEKYKVKSVEYRTMDFYGPFLTMKMRQYKGGKIDVIPLHCKIETAEVSKNHFSLLCKATQELYWEIGEFTLKTKLFEVIINSEKTEELLLEKLKSLKLF